MLFLENEVLLEAAIMRTIENHHPDRVKMVLCKFASRMEKKMHPSLTYLILKVRLKSAPYSLNRVKPQEKSLLSNFFFWLFNSALEIQKQRCLPDVGTAATVVEGFSGKIVHPARVLYALSWD